MMAAKRAVVAVLVVLFLVGGASPQSVGGNRAQTISNIFQIPIQTLTAISNFAQNTRPLGEILQRRRPQQVQQIQQIPSSGSSRPLPNVNYYRSRAAQIAGLYTATDGSGFRI